MTDPSQALSSPASARNRDPILAALRAHLPPNARVLEIASGAGEHAVWFAQALPGVQWRPSDREPAALASISAWRAQAGPPNLLAPVRLDAADAAIWPEERFDALVCINMVHISPWAATEGLMAGAGAGRLLTPGGVLFLYGPYREAEAPLAPSNAAFDLDLKARNPEWGLRELDEVTALAASHGLTLKARIPMPANNLSLVFVKG